MLNNFEGIISGAGNIEAGYLNEPTPATLLFIPDNVRFTLF